MDSVETSLIKSIAKQGATEIGTDIAEIAVDALLNEGPIRDIPVIGTLIKSYDLAKNIKEQLFARKVLLFLQSIESCTDKDRESLLGEIQREKGSPERSGIAVVQILDRLDDMQKPALIGKLFLCCANGIINSEELFRMCNLVDRLYVKDLLALSKIGKPIAFTTDELSSYAAAGIYLPKMREPVTQRSILDKQDNYVRRDEIPKMQFEFTSAALRLAELLFEAKREVHIFEI